MRIVVVEDEMCIREGLVKLLERIDRSYIVVGQADNGKSGLELIKESKPDPEIFRVAAEKIRRANAYHGRPRDAALPAGKAALAEGYHSQRVF